MGFCNSSVYGQRCVKTTLQDVIGLNVAYMDDIVN